MDVPPCLGHPLQIGKEPRRIELQWQLERNVPGGHKV
jgi:hypothetical protein